MRDVGHSTFESQAHSSEAQRPKNQKRRTAGGLREIEPKELDATAERDKKTREIMEAITGAMKNLDDTKKMSLARDKDMFMALAEQAAKAYPNMNLPNLLRHVVSQIDAYILKENILHGNAATKQDRVRMQALSTIAETLYGGNNKPKIKNEFDLDSIPIEEPVWADENGDGEERRAA